MESTPSCFSAAKIALPFTMVLSPSTNSGRVSPNSSTLRTSWSICFSLCVLGLRGFGFTADVERYSIWSEGKRTRAFLPDQGTCFIFIFTHSSSSTLLKPVTRPEKAHTGACQMHAGEMFPFLKPRIQLNADCRFKIDATLQSSVCREAK